jgi:hypothetical protein
VSTSLQFLMVIILNCAWCHLKDIKELILTQANEFFQLLCSSFLVICCFMINIFARNEHSLLDKLLFVAHHTISGGLILLHPTHLCLAWLV